MRQFAKRASIIVLALALPGLFAAQAMAVASLRSGRASQTLSAPAVQPARPVYLPADDPKVSRAPRPAVVKKKRVVRKARPLQPVPDLIPTDRADGTNPDSVNVHGALIEIDKVHQRLTAWQDGHVVMTFRISTGRVGWETPTGHYRVKYKNAKAYSYDWDVWMPWAMNWYGNYFIHELPYYDGASNNRIGTNELGRPASHGCVRVGLGNAEALYKWTAMRTPVWVH